MLRPDYFYNSVYEIPYHKLREQNIRGLIFDLDNTLAAFDDKLPPAKTVALIKKLQAMGFEVCILTNNTPKRLKGFNKGLKIKGIANGLKPFTKGIRMAMATMGTTKEETMIVGDQLFSDVWGGKNAGIGTILVKPITERDFAVVKIKRLAERAMLRNYFKAANGQ